MFLHSINPALRAQQLSYQMKLYVKSNNSLAGLHVNVVLDMEQCRASVSKTIYSIKAVRLTDFAWITSPAYI